MESDILQKFLDRGLLNLGEDTDKFNYVTSAASDLANALKQDRQKLIRASSMLVGSTLAEGEPLVGECEEAIKTHWPTYRGRFPSGTTQLFRATILQAIANITREESDIDCAAIVFYTTAGLIPLATAETEDEIFREFVSAFGNRVEAEAVKLWGSGKDITMPALQYSDGAVVPASIDAKALKEALTAAVINTGTNPNPHGFGSAEWADHFAQHAANVISSGVAAVVKDAVAKLASQIRADGKTLSGAIGSTLNSLASDRHNSEILYWKESLFSPGLSTSYRKMSADAAVYWAALDLHTMVPRYHPVSVEYFLRETIRAALGKDEAIKGITCTGFCRELARTPQSVTAAQKSVAGQRLMMLEAAQAAATKELEVKAAAAQTGIPAEARIPREEIGVWLFRDSQALRLAGGR